MLFQICTYVYLTLTDLFPQTKESNFISFRDLFIDSLTI